MLPTATQVKVDELVDLLTVDFRDSRLHSKKLNLSIAIYSFRAGRDYRVLFRFSDGATIELLDVRHRKDIYRSLK
jgi:mRNA-degrading endonuclease RelE of RelBE toxin-antitoxin system